MYSRIKNIIFVFMIIILTSCSSNYSMNREEEINEDIEADRGKDAVEDNEMGNEDEDGLREDNSIDNEVHSIDVIKRMFMENNKVDDKIYNMMDLGSALITSYDQGNVIIQSKEKASQLDIGYGSYIRETSLKKNEDKLSICYNDSMRLFDLSDLKLMAVYKYEEIDDELDISPDMMQIVYLDNKQNLYVANVENMDRKQFVIQQEINEKHKIMNPIFLDNTTVLVELIGDYPVGTNLIQIDLESEEQQYLHISDYISGHSSFLDGDMQYAVLSNDFGWTIVDMNTFEVIDTVDLTEEIGMIPKFSHGYDQLLYLDSDHNIVILTLDSMEKQIVDQNWEGDFLAWTYDDRYIFGNKITNGNSQFYSIELEE